MAELYAGTPNILSHRLNLTDEEIRRISVCIVEAENEPIPHRELLSELKMALITCADGGTVNPIEALYNRLRDQNDLLVRSIAYRAYAAGREAGRKQQGG